MDTTVYFDMSDIVTIKLNLTAIIQNLSHIYLQIQFT